MENVHAIGHKTMIGHCLNNSLTFPIGTGHIGENTTTFQTVVMDVVGIFIHEISGEMIFI